MQCNDFVPHEWQNWLVVGARVDVPFLKFSTFFQENINFMKKGFSQNLQFSRKKRYNFPKRIKSRRGEKTLKMVFLNLPVSWGTSRGSTRTCRCGLGRSAVGEPAWRPVYHVGGVRGP